jgi:DNA repair exonuclease SbcCD ATPase subunit
MLAKVNNFFRSIFSRTQSAIATADNQENKQIGYSILKTTLESNLESAKQAKLELDSELKTIELELAHLRRLKEQSTNEIEVLRENLSKSDQEKQKLKSDIARISRESDLEKEELKQKNSKQVAETAKWKNITSELVTSHENIKTAHTVLGEEIKEPELAEALKFAFYSTSKLSEESIKTRLKSADSDRLISTRFKNLQRFDVNSISSNQPETPSPDKTREKTFA